VRLLHEPMDRVVLRGRVLRPWRERQFAAFGADSLIDRPEWIYGSKYISIGRGVVILSGARLSAEQETWAKKEPSLVIGDGSIFRSHFTASATSRVEIEANVLCAARVSVIDSEHTITETEQNPLWNPAISKPTRVGEGSWLAENVVVLGGARIGRKCIIGANSVVKGEIPDYAVAVGAPARVVGSTLES
jgi:acetyltransferase-like isoleucine patch superfamily enzyme